MRRWLTAISVLMLACSAAHAEDETPTYAFGAGVQRMPTWQGSKNHRNQAIPYVDINLPGVGELSTTDGLTIDLLGDDRWHGGIYGNWLWDRTHDDLGRLGGKVTSLSPRFIGGGYLEYDLSKQLTVGTHVAHDLDGAGAYWGVYADLDLPKIGYIEHSVELLVEGMNGSAMGRFFGLTALEAENLGTPTWHPGGGRQQVSLGYDAFIPTSEHTGFALGLTYGRLLGNAAASPLVRRFGTRNQFTQTLAFVYHF